MNRKKIYQGFTAFWLLLVGILSLIPIPRGVELGSDKKLHFLFYLTTTMVVYFAFSNSRFLKALFIAVVIVFLYGILIEILQSVVPYRSFSWGDILANAAGVVTYAVSYLIFYSIKTRFFS